MGKRIYLIRILEENIVWKRHLDQLIKAVDFIMEPEQESEDIKNDVFTTVKEGVHTNMNSEEEVHTNLTTSYLKGLILLRIVFLMLNKS